nr:ParB N-terminal domain-containing protein [uncultured Cetobacterium sp.]
MKKFNLSNNHLNNLGDINGPVLEKTSIAKFSDFQNITNKLIKEIDFEDRSFINRLSDESEIEGDENFLSLYESIKGAGLLNPIYLLKKEDKYTIISGWRRSLALRKLFNENPNKIYSQKAIVFRDNTPTEILEQTSIDENTKRKDLSILELSYKFNKMSDQAGVTIEDCLSKFNIGKSQFHAIKKAITFNAFIKERLLEEVGPVKADILNKIYENAITKMSEEEAKELVLSSKDMTREDLRKFLSQMVKENVEKKKDVFQFKRNKKQVSFVIKDSVSQEDYEKIQNFIKNLLKK